MTRWVVTKQWTVRVVTDERETVVGGAPLIRRFAGQPYSNLLRWAEKSGLVAVEPTVTAVRLSARR
jgi:hypothetical protein